MPYDYKAKTKNVNQLNNYMLAKTLSMFEYTGLPETIPAKELEKILQLKGFAFISEVNGKLYALSATKSGEQDAYGNCLQVTIANVYLKFNKTLSIADDGVLFSNDEMDIGLYPLFEKCNSQLVENEINMTMWGFNSRTQKLLSAPDDKTAESANQYIKKIIDGELSVIGDNAMFDGVKVQPTNTGNGFNIQSMIEYQQYIKSTLYNEIGISSNFNMKRERLVQGEVEQNEDSLFPFVYNMLQCRMDAVARINEKYGLNITVDFGSVWKIKQVELEHELNNEQKTTHGNSENGSENNSDDNIKTEKVTEIIDNNNDGNGERGQATDTSADTNNNASDNQEDNQEVLKDEQEQRESDNSDNSDNSGNDSESEKEIADLQAVIDNPESSEADKKAAQELLNEIKVRE